MKKIVALIIALIIMGSVASAEEILFRDIPWGSNVAEVLNAMPPYSNECDFDWETRIDAWNSFDIENEKMNNGEKPTIFYYDNLIVAGYKVSNITFQFLFSVDDEGVIRRDRDSLMLKGAAYGLSVSDAEMAFTDLSKKLTGLYGKGKEGNEDGSQTITWYGDNNTGVCLEYSENHIMIWYGNTDESIISDLDKALTKEEIDRANGNTDGL